MRNVNLKQIASDNSVLIALQQPDVPPGWNRPGGTLTIQISDVPDGVSDSQALHLYQQTAVYHTPESEYVVRFSDLQPGKVVMVGKRQHPGDDELVNMSGAAQIVGVSRQAIYASHKASQRPSYRGSFPRAVKVDPDGGNPWFIRREIEFYARHRNDPK